MHIRFAHYFNHGKLGKIDFIGKATRFSYPEMGMTTLRIGTNATPLQCPDPIKQGSIEKKGWIELSYPPYSPD